MSLNKIASNKLDLRFLRPLLVLGMLFSCSGCVLAGYAAKVYGAPPVKPAYVPAKTPMVVLAHDMPDPTGMRMDADIVTREVETQIATYAIAPLVPSWKVDEVRRAHLSGFENMSPQQLGTEAGASQVLFIDILSSSVSAGPASDMVKGDITTRVSIVDVPTGRQLWPTDGSNGAIVSYSTPSVRLTDRNTALGISRAIHAGVGVNIVRLFRTYKPDDD